MMKSLLTALFLLFFYFSTYAQRAYNNPYLVVRIEEGYDQVNSSKYWMIKADAGNPNAAELYNLHPYPNKIVPADYIVHFYKSHKDLPPFFNYFKSTTVALNYMVQQGWRLMTVTTETTTQANRSSGGAYTGITTTPVYYFKWVTFDN